MIPSPFGGEGGVRSTTVEGAVSTLSTLDLFNPTPHPSAVGAHLLSQGEKEYEYAE
ncbi:hypothetical protein D3C87_391900 [compost metagenome]